MKISLKKMIINGIVLASAAMPFATNATTINNDLVGPGPVSNPYPTPPGGNATGGTSTTVNNAVFTVAPLDNSGTGTGAFNPFLRTHHHGNNSYESGFNTDASDVLDNVGGVWTHSVKLGDLTTIDYQGNSYVRLFLDLGEPDANEKPLLSMLELELWVHTIGDDDDYSDGLGAKVWSLDGLDGLSDTTLNLDYNIVGGGNGKFDAIALFDASLFASYDANKFFYLYNKFGKVSNNSSDYQYPTEGTFEEWAFDTTGNPIDFCTFGCATDPVTPVPEPDGIALLGIGLLGMGLSRKTRKQ